MLAACGPFCEFGPWQVRQSALPGLRSIARIVRAVRIVAGEAGDAARVHQALTKSLPCMRFLCAVPSAKCVKRRFTELVLFKLPKICQVQADVEADRPIVVFPLDRVGRRTALRVTLDADVVGVHIIRSAPGLRMLARVGLGNMLAARTVAPLAADVPFGDRFGRDVVVHRMAAVAKRPGRPLEIVRRIKRRPPVGRVRHEIGPPHLVRDVPLRGLREIVVADLREISLLPAAAIDERDVVFRKSNERIGLGEVGNDRVGMLARIAHHVRHSRFAPARIDILVALLAGGRTDIMRAKAAYWLALSAAAAASGATERQVANEGDELPNLPVR